MSLVSAWTEGRHVYLVTRDPEGVKLRKVPAKWSFFVSGLDADDLRALARDPKIVGVKVVDGGSRVRIDCVSKFARRDIVEILSSAGRGYSGFELYETDVSPVRRLLSDVSSLEVDPYPRLGYFDLETDSRKSFAEACDGKARILSWAITGESGTSSAVLEKDSFRSEQDLLRRFFEAASDYDCLLAWNGQRFDFLVLQNRSDALKVKVKGRDVQWHRWCWLDHLEVFKKYNQHSDDSGIAKVSYALDHVANHVLGEGKHDFDASKTWEAWEAGGESRERLLRYNVQDTELLPRIESANGYVALHLATCHICRVFPDTESLSATVQGDGFLIRLGAENGYRWPPRPNFDDQPAAFAGAYVMEPKRTGLIDNVHVADFAGLYPSIMRTWNMGVDTKLDGPREGAYKLPSKSTWFRSDRPGMFRIALDRLVEKRAEYQKEMKKYTPGTEEHNHYSRLSKAFKVVANSFYGICGSPFSRYFDAEVAEGVTQTGKWLLQDVISEAEAVGMDPFYGDTDSVFVTGCMAETFKQFVADVNTKWSDKLAPFGIDEHFIDLDFEKTFKRIILVSAKRYAGRFATYKGKAALADAKPEVKGLEFKRGDTLAIARDLQIEVVQELLSDGCTAEDVRAIVELRRRQFFEGELKPDDVVLRQSLSRPLSEYAERYTVAHCTGCKYGFESTSIKGPSKCPSCGRERAKATQPAHVRVAHEMSRRGVFLTTGDRVAYYVVGGGGGKQIVPVPASDEGAFERIDRSYYWESRIYPPTQRVLVRAFPDGGWEESSALKRQRRKESGGQTTLDLGKPRRRRRRKVVVVFREPPPGAAEKEDGGLGHRRMLAVRAAIEAHPGAVPVDLEFRWDGGRVRLPTGLRVETSTAARIALERVASEVSGIAVK